MENKTRRFGVFGAVGFFLMIAAAVILHSRHINFYFETGTFDLIHVTVESFFNVILMCIYFLVFYSYPYERKLNYVFSGSLFLCAGIFNILQIYSTLDKTQFIFITSNMVYLTLALSLLLSVLLPESPSSFKRWIIFVIPMLLSCVGILYISVAKVPRNLSNMYPDYFEDQTLFYILIIIVNTFTLLMVFRKYIRDKKKSYLNLMNGIQLFSLSVIFMALSVKNNDIYSLFGHIVKLASTAYIFSMYFIANINRTYKEIGDAKQKIEEISNIKTDFIVNLSHELRTPVNVIINALKLLDFEGNDSKYAKSIEKNAYRLNKVCESIIEFNEIENGSMEFSYSRIDIVFLIDEILEEAEEIADEKALDIFFNFRDNYFITSDYEKLKRVILNLVSNSIKYAPIKGMINITLEVSYGIKLTILNNGPGIPEEEIEKVFDKFYKYKNDMLESTEGLGIGLYISKRYAEMLGGSINIISQEDCTGYELLLPEVCQENQEQSGYNLNSVKGFFSDIH